MLGEYSSGIIQPAFLGRHHSSLTMLAQRMTRLEPGGGAIVAPGRLVPIPGDDRCLSVTRFVGAMQIAGTERCAQSPRR